MAAAGKQMRVGALVLAACLAALIQSSMAATSHTVGDSTGWTIPTSNSIYSTWAAKQTFKVGDTLVFNFQTGTHTVAEVSKSAYDACTTSNPISTISTGPASITLSTAGTHYYICTIPGHCLGGQKLAVTATSSTSAAPTTSPTSSPAPSTSTPPSATPTSSPSPATAAAPTPSSTSEVPTPSVAATPTGSPTVPSAQTPSGGTTAPAPSSATVAGAGFLIPVMMVAAAFLA